MAVPTTQEMLDNVRTAINARIVNGAVQSYSMPGGRNIQSFSLDELTRLETRLMSRLAGENGGTRNYAAFNNID